MAGAKASVAANVADAIALTRRVVRSTGFAVLSVVGPFLSKGGAKLKRAEIQGFRALVA